uniref:CB1 cannabinoid receptor-interacting protein 1 n=1 Tax=Rhabditophanes sp. KR3021 TaxID=114890 RepID=A0AC35UBT1_9BILA
MYRTSYSLLLAKFVYVCIANNLSTFSHLHVGGSDMALHSNEPNRMGDYMAVWNTAGFEVTPNNSRYDLHITIQGPDGNMTHLMQAKFYSVSDSHATTGDKIEKIQWKCSVDENRTITVNDEIIKSFLR